jgi:hypothetical protein
MFVWSMIESYQPQKNEYQKNFDFFQGPPPVSAPLPVAMLPLLSTHVIEN